MDMVRQSGFFVEYSYQHLDEQIAETFVNQAKQQLSSLTPTQETILKRSHNEKAWEIKGSNGRTWRNMGRVPRKGRSKPNPWLYKTARTKLSRARPVEIRGKPVGDCVNMDGLEGQAKIFFQGVRADDGFHRLFRPSKVPRPT
jgi:hypothetical protein